MAPRPHRPTRRRRVADASDRRVLGDFVLRTRIKGTENQEFGVPSRPADRAWSLLFHPGIQAHRPRRRRAMRSTPSVADLTRLAQVESAKVFDSEPPAAPSFLQIIAQASGLNWELKAVVGDHDPRFDTEYWPYLIVETKTGPGWPKEAGRAPYIPPQHLGLPIFRTGSKGIVVIGTDYREEFAVEAPSAARLPSPHRAPALRRVA